MSKINIDWLSDDYDCETCGGSYASGAVITKDGEEVFSLIPQAHCYGGQSIDERDVFLKLLEVLGHEVTENY